MNYILKNVTPIAFTSALFVVALLLFWKLGSDTKCACAVHIPDQRLQDLEGYGFQEVDDYLWHRATLSECLKKREELLKMLKKEKILVE